MASVHSLRVGIDARAAVAGAAQASGAMATVGNSAVTAGKKVQGFGMNLRYLAGGLIGLMVIKDVIKTIVDFEKQMKIVTIVTGATGKSFDDLEAKARKLGATTRFTATEAAEGMTFLARAGFKSAQVLEMIPQTLNLATAAVIDLGASSDMVANTIHQFSMNAEEAERVVDSFMITANNANTDVLQLGQALQYAGTFAGALGITLEETNAALGIMADSGIKGSMAGTQMRGVMAALIKPTDKAGKALEELGLKASDVNPAIHDLNHIFKTFKKAQEGMTDKTKFAALMLDIFSRRPVAAALALTKMSGTLSIATLRQLELAGATEEAAKAMEDTLFGSLKALRSAMQEMWLVTGDEGVGGAFRVLIDLLTSTIRILAGARESVEKYSTAAEVLAFVLKVLITRMVALAVIGIGKMFLMMAKAIWAAVAAQIGLNTAVAANPFGLILTGISVAVVALWDFITTAREATKAQRDLTEELEEFNDTKLAIAGADASLAKLGEVMDLHEKLLAKKKEMMELHDINRNVAGEAYADGTVPDYTRSTWNYPVSEGSDAFTGGWKQQAQDDWNQILKDLKEYGQLAVTLTAGTLNELNKEWGRWEQDIENHGGELDKFSKEELRALESFLGEYSAALQEYGKKTRREQFSQFGVQIAGPDEMKERITLLTKMKALIDITQGDFDMGGESKANSKFQQSMADLEFKITLLGKEAEEVARASRNRAIDNLAVAEGLDLGSAEVALMKQYAEYLAQQLSLEKQKKVADLEAARASERKLEADKQRQLQMTSSYNEVVQNMEMERYALEHTTEELKKYNYERMLRNQFGDMDNSEERIQWLIREREEIDRLSGTTEAYGTSMKEIQEALAQATTDAVMAVVSGSQTIIGALEGIVLMLIEMTIRAVMYQMIMKAVMFGGGGMEGAGDPTSGWNAGSDFNPDFMAKGAIMSGGSPTAFARGGVVHSPTIFPMAQGRMGLMGESGAEAIMPLARLNDGSLGVKAQGNTGGNVIINMSVTTPNADSFRKSEKQITRSLSKAVRASAQN